MVSIVTTRPRASLPAAVLAAALLAAVAMPAQAEQSFASPEAAADALFTANQTNNKAALLKIFGAGGDRLVHSGDPVTDRNGRARFAAAYVAGHMILQDGDKAVLLIGDEQWPFPIPLVKRGRGWRFDAKAGSEEVIDRRIGRDELNAIEVCRAFVDAEREYYAQDPLGQGQHEYAQHFVSHPRKHDGLYWEAAAGATPSPMGPLIANARAESNEDSKTPGKPEPYQGYFYRILTRQGPSALGGPRDYVVKGHMIGGFALLAFPARYGDSGVMSFIVNQDGTVFERNLGHDTAEIARTISEYNPDDEWKPAP
jgi:hypothetical protein